MKQSTGPILFYGDDNSCPDIRYLTGFHAVDPVQLLVVEGRCHLLLPPLEVGRAQKETRRVTITSTASLKSAKRKTRSLAGPIVDWVESLGIRTLTVSQTFPLGVADALRKKRVKVSVAKSSLCPQREVKKPAEVAKIKESQKASVAAARAAIQLIKSAEITASGELRVGRKTLTSELVKETIHKKLFEHQCFCGSTIVAGGSQGADPHNRGSGPLRANESIILDIFPQHMETGYWGDLTRTVVRGTPSPTLKRMYKAVKQSHADALNAIKAGVEGRYIHEVAAAALVEAGFETGVENGVPVGFFHSTGHGVGLEIHEAPGLGKHGKTLKAGNVVTVEPGLYYPEHGGVRIEDTVVVTRTGFDFLATCPKTFVI